MGIRSVFIKIISAILTALSICGICILLYLNSESIPYILIFTLCIAAAFVFISFFKNSFSKKTTDIIFVALSVCILLSGIFFSPYNPCHDSLDLHNVLNYMLQNNNDMSEGWYIKTYINFFINNKFVIYIYLPFVHLFKNAEIGIRFLNGFLLIGTVFFTASASNRLMKKDSFSSVLLMLSILSPFLLLSGPYIYLPSVFIASAAVLCYTLRGVIGKVLFLASAAALFVLRPTCFGFLLMFIVLDTFLRFDGKKEFMKKLVSLAFTVILAFTFKTALGEAMYRTGIHKYPNMLNAAGVWTLELGTRTNGEQTGTCFYSPFEPTEEDIAAADNIQKDFYTLWKYYLDDSGDNTANYDNIVNLQNILQRKIINRLIARTPEQFFEHFYLKTVNFFKDTYIPYYYKTNLNDESIKIWRNYDQKYFSYLNAVFLLFFISMIINFIRIITGRDKTDGAAVSLGAAAIAVNMVFLLLTEVQKKYMFDFYVPMAMCTAMMFSFSVKKSVKKPVSIIAAAALVFMFAFNESLYDIKILRNAKLTFTQNGEECSVNVKMKETCRGGEYYIYNPKSGEKLYLLGKNEFSVSFPKESFNAFVLCRGDKEIKSFSAQLIKN